MEPWIRKEGTAEPRIRESGGVVTLHFDRLDQEEWLLHAFSTRHGGVSLGTRASMDLSLKQDADTRMENFSRIARAVGFDVEAAVCSYQTHTVNIRRVTAEDAGKGLTAERDYQDIDGLICDVPGLTLVTFYADCVPLFFADTKNHVIGLAHSGWRGTTARMGREMVHAMQDAFGTKPEDLICAVGPSICGSCFEVGPEVEEAFAQTFTPEQMKRIVTGRKGDRSYIDLWSANREILLEAGVPGERISVSGICTRCNPQHLFSHRIMGADRGSLAAFMGIRK